MNLLAWLRSLLLPGIGAILYIYATGEHATFNSEMDAFDFAESRQLRENEYTVVSRQSFASPEDVL